MRCTNIVLLCVLMHYSAVSLVFSIDLREDFSRTSVGWESGKADWIVVDEPPEDLGNKEQSSWYIKAQPGLNGRAMIQNSNIWGDATDTVAIGSFVIYDRAEWSDFILEVDVLALDNDGMGLVWRWTDRLNHYRYITMLDPNNSPRGRKGPYRLIERRLGNDRGAELPFYGTLAENQEAYERGVRQTWRLEAIGNTFAFYVDDELTLEAHDSTYKRGKIGFLVYAQLRVIFDNLTVTDLWAVDSQDKLVATWAKIKSNLIR